jgi:hypothetical protein
MKIPPCLFLFAGFVLAGCTAPTEPVAAPASAASALAALKKGQTATQVKALLGEPASIRPFPASVAGLGAEEWVYRRVLAESERQVPITTREVPAVNPITGLPFTVNEPVYETQAGAVVEVTALLMVEDRLIAWKSQREAGSRILPR